MPPRQSDSTRALARAADAHMRAGQFNEAVASYRKLTRQQARNAEAHYRLGSALLSLGDVDDAIRSLEKAATLDRRSPTYQFALAGAYQRGGVADKAIECCTRAAWLDPGNVDGLRGLATMYEKLHRLDDAEETLAKALKVLPGDPMTNIIQARIDRRRGRQDQAVARLQALVAARPPDESLYHALFELARALDKLDRTDEAFEIATRANQVQAGTPGSQAFKPELQYVRMDEYRTIPPEHYRQWAEAPAVDDGPPPAFLVGFPRSGTTLTEQILQAHSAVVATDERPIVHASMKRMYEFFPQKQTIGHMLETMSEEQRLLVRAAYREAERRHARPSPETRVVLNKFPLHITMLGFINRVFPDARVIVALRDPRDVCLSCFFQDFQPNPSMVNFNRLEDAARYYNAVMQLWLHQKELLTLNLHEIRYERTTDDVDGQSRELIEFLGLPWEDEVLRFYEQSHQRFVTTPSYEAVSEPVNKKARGKWRRYEKQLSPLIEAIRPTMEQLGYD